jgi:hypothetical protein
MKRFTGLALMAVFALFCIETANAEPNSSERVRAFAKMPDWSGVWAQFNAGPTGLPEDPVELKAFIAAVRQHPPYNAEWEAKSQALKVARASQPDKPLCLFGFPALMIGSPYMFQVVVAPEQTVLIFSARETRHIYTDGRPHPPKDELFATPWGDSVGHWDGQTLMVDTVATSSPANVTGEPLSERATLTERIRLLNKNTLQDQITIEDPVALTHPWQLTRQYYRVPNMNRLFDEVCGETERNPVVNGKFTIAPPKP